MDKATEVIDRFLTEYGSRQTFNRTEVVDFVLDIRSALLSDKVLAEYAERVEWSQNGTYPPGGYQVAP